MSKTISINWEEAYEALDKLDSKFKSFDSYTKNFLQTAKGRFEGFQSELSETLDIHLKNMADSSGPKMLNHIQTYAVNARSAVKAMQQTDDNIAAEFLQEG